MSGVTKLLLGIVGFVVLCSVLSDGFGPLGDVVWGCGVPLFWGLVIAIGVAVLVGWGRK